MAAISFTPPLTVGIVGRGLMGKNHERKVESLAADQRVSLAWVVDTDPSKLTDSKVAKYTSLELACKNTIPDIVVICPNTKNHGAELVRLWEIAAKSEKVVHVLVEKPLVANSKEGEIVKKLYSEEKGYLSSGYLFRQSLIVSEAIEYIQKQKLTIEKIDTVWQKDRMAKGPARPSEGVHTDEATHPADLIINCLLPQVGVRVDCVTILSSSFKRQSELGQIVDQKEQDKLYYDDPLKKDPIAEVKYTLDVNGIPVTGFSSYKKGPQRREITLEFTDKTSLFFEFDVEACDRLTKLTPWVSTVLYESKKDKLMLEWEAFLEYITTGQESYRIQTVSEMLFDVHFTEALGQDFSSPLTINKAS